MSGEVERALERRNRAEAAVDKALGPLPRSRQPRSGVHQYIFSQIDALGLHLRTEGDPFEDGVVVRVMSPRGIYVAYRATGRWFADGKVLTYNQLIDALRKLGGTVEVATDWSKAWVPTAALGADSDLDDEEDS